MAFKHYWKLLRPVNCVMASVAVAIGYWVSASAIVYSNTLLLAMVSVFLICGAGQSINDYFDREIDQKIRPEKPIPSGSVKANQVHYYSIALFLVGIGLSYFINSTAFLIAIVYSILLYLYSAVMQRWKYVGNWIVAAGTALTLLYGATLSQRYSLVLLLALSVFFSNLSREITKDLEDQKADLGFKKTLPMVLGVRNARISVLFYFLLSIVSAFVPITSGIVTKLPYSILVLATAVLFAYAGMLCWKQSYKKSQSWAKYGMMVGLIAFLSAAL